MRKTLSPRLLALLLCLSITACTARRLQDSAADVADPAAATPVQPAAPSSLHGMQDASAASVGDAAAQLASENPSNAPMDVAVNQQPKAEGPNPDSTGTLETMEAATSSARLPQAAAAPTVCDGIVVGAGLAGLKAAADLKAKGFNVVVLEGRSRLGGRVYSAKLGSGTNTVEVGAQWFHGNNPNAAWDIATNNLGITTVPTSDSVTLRYSKNSSTTSDSRFQTTYDNFGAYEDATTFPNSASLQTALDQFLAANPGLSDAQKQGLKHFINTEVEQEFGASASWLSENFYDEGLNYGGSDSVMPNGKNLVQLVTYLASTLTSAIKYSHNVTQVAYSSTGVTVTALTGGTTVTFQGKFAIVAVPLGVLKRRGPGFFSPALPTAKQTAISRLGMGLLNKVILEFPSTHLNKGPFADNTWWIERLPELSGESGWWMEFFNLRKALGVPILVAFQAGQPAVDAENSMTDAATIASVMVQLRTWYGATWPDPVNSLVTRWWNDPWTYGSYSYQGPGCTDTERDTLASSVSNRLWLAGEHVSADYPATMQGALLSGKAAAAGAAGRYIPSG